jgi:hypothetical protein
VFSPNQRTSVHASALFVHGKRKQNLELQVLAVIPKPEFKTALRSYDLAIGHSEVPEVGDLQGDRDLSLGRFLAAELPPSVINGI